MVLPDCEDPWSEPVTQRSDHACSDLGMAPEDLPLLVIGAFVLVEDLVRDLELADVVEQPGPVQPIHLARVEADFVTDHLGVGAYPFRVPARDPVVRIQRGHQFQDSRCGLGWGLAHLPGARILDDGA